MGVRVFARSGVKLFAESEIIIPTTIYRRGVRPRVQLRKTGVWTEKGFGGGRVFGSIGSSRSSRSPLL